MTNRLYILVIFFIFALYMVMLPPQLLDHFGFLYVSVAWEMYVHHHWILPLLDARPYAQKPPLTFWIIISGWHIFGHNIAGPRLLIALLTPFTALLTARLAKKMFPTAEGVGIVAALMLLTGGGAGLSKLPQFRLDSILMFFTLVSLYSIYQYFQTEKRRYLIFLAFAIALALLTKGPVVFIFIMPPYILALLAKKMFLNNNRSTFFWLSMLLPLLAIIIGTMVALFWAVLASFQGGKAYAHTLFWGSMSQKIELNHHITHFLFYWPALVIFFLPWPIFSLLNLKKFHPNWRSIIILLIIIIPSLLIMSFIGVQSDRYIMPLAPAIAIFWAYLLAAGGYTKRLRISAVLLFFIAGMLSAIVFFWQHYHPSLSLFFMNDKAFLFFSVLSYILMLIIMLVRVQSFSSFMLIFFICYGILGSVVVTTYLRAYSHKGNYFLIGQRLKQMKDKDYHFAVFAPPGSGSKNSPRYFEFMAGLDKPIPHMFRRQSQIWMKNCKKCCLLFQKSHYGFTLHCQEGD